MYSVVNNHDVFVTVEGGLYKETSKTDFRKEQKQP